MASNFERFGVRNEESAWKMEIYPDRRFGYLDANINLFQMRRKIDHAEITEQQSADLSRMICRTLYQTAYLDGWRGRIGGDSFFL